MALKIYTVDPVTIASGGVAYQIYPTQLFAASITIQAGYDNVGRISVGDDSVTPSNGIQVAPGESAVIEYSVGSARHTEEFDLSKIYVTSASAGDIVRVSYIKRE